MTKEDPPPHSPSVSGYTTFTLEMFKDLVKYYDLTQAVDEEMKTFRNHGMNDKWLSDETIKIIKLKLLPFVGVA